MGGKNCRRLAGDTVGSERVFYPFVLIFAFVLILAFVISGVAQYITAGSMAQGAYGALEMPFGLTNYTTILADDTDSRYVDYGDEEGYLVSDDDVIDEIPYPTHEDPFLFWPESDPEEIKYVHIIRNNVRYDPDSTNIWEKYLDFIAVRRHTGAFDWEPQWNNAAIPFSELAANFWNITNVSVTEFQLSGSSDSFFINTSDGGYGNFTAALWSNEFNLFYGWSRFRLEEVDFWEAIAMVIYADIPGVDDTIDWFIHGFVIAVIVFVVFTMAIRMTPFLGGG